MKPLKRRLVVCIVPVVLGIILIGIAFWNYTQEPITIFGKPLARPTFKPGVDLVGGTILVYEIDPDKKPENYNKEQLVAALKRRLDPADLYNITIRPLSDTRVEIILPTGGRHRAELQKKKWQELLAKVEEEWPKTEGKLGSVRRGDTAELAQRISEIDPKISAGDIDKFIGDKWTADKERALTGEEVERIKDLIQRVGSLEFRILANKHDDGRENGDAIKVASKYFEEAAKNWNEFISAVKLKYPDVTKPAGDDKRTLSDIAMGDTAELEDLIVKRSGEPLDSVKQFIRTKFKPNEQLADLMARAAAGVPPPAPVSSDGKTFKVTLEDGEHRISYAWVELSKSYLHDLHLNSDAVEDAIKKAIDEGRASNAEEARKLPEVQEVEAVLRTAAKARNEGIAIASNDLLPGDRLGTKDWAALLFSRKIPNPKVRLAAKDRDKKYEYFILTRNPEPGKEVTGEYLTSAREDTGKRGGLAVGFRFNTKGGNLFGELTNANRPPREGSGIRYLAIALDSMIMSAPTIQSPITGGSGIIEGKFTKPEIDFLINVFRSGALPATLKPQPVSENTMGATLGDDTIRAGVISIGLAFAAVLVFMLVYYRFAGFVACVALLANLILTIGFMLLVNATFTLPGLAGLVLTLAMAVDANVLIYERIREERERGASLALAIRNGYDRAFPTVIDTHMSSIFTAIVLYVVGNDQLKGFGISLTVGLIISLFTALYMTRTYFDLWQVKGWLKKLSMAKLFSRTRINFMGIRNVVFAVTIALSVFGVGVFLLRGTSGLNMDFVGGTVYSGELDKFMNISELRDRLDEANQKKWLALAKDPEPVREGVWRLVYEAEEKGREHEREIYIPEKLTPKQVRERAEILPEPSLELIFHSDENLTQGNESKLFTVRTTEKSSELVSASINRLLGDVLQKNRLESAQTNQAFLIFPEATKLDKVRPLVLAALRKGGVITKKAASPRDTAARIARLGAVGGGPLAAAAEAALADSDSDVTLTGQEETGDKGQYKTATLNFTQPVEVSKLADALVPLVKDKKLSNFQFDQARLTLEDAAYLASVHSLLGNQFDDAQLRQHMSVTKPEGVQEDESGRFKAMLVRMPSPIDGVEFKQAIEKFGKELAARPLPVRLENFDSQLAADMQQRALYAILASWGAMLLYLWFRFGNWTFGLAAVICLIHDLFFTLGMIALCHWLHGTFIGSALALRDFKIDLPAVASLLTLIGFSVNDTIVVFDRIREVRGKNPHLTPEMINDSINQTLSRTVLTSFIAWMVVLVLYIWGGEGVHLFAFVMVFGVIVGTYSSIYVASPLLLLLGEGAPRKGVRVRDERPAATTEG